ncbi:MAG: acyl-CoA dehydrogenase [Deltaproteobacteria bacterium CG2_30_63_29]|nr:MAG: acyl-CoA dehydrogenase [Deltaproteobacteria bacterium CG2_30_63_29]PJB47890.1 MAG: acyl-CoA dehydrogenase [Deltaproteobacteria bacterium CG_4_9_14_3_um_filter_63_12]
MWDLRLNEEQTALVDMIRRFTKEEVIPVAAELDEKSEFPLDVCKKAWDLGFMNSKVPAEYGGLGLGVFESVLISEELSYGCVGVATTVLANNLAATPLVLAGTEAQKEKYLGQLVNEYCFASYATSEPGAGSDVVGIRTKYEKQGDDYLINGSKAWITNGGHAKWYLIFATSDAKLRHKGLTAFVVPRDLEGVSVGKKENKLGVRCSDTSTIHFDNVRLTKDHLVGEEGDGFKLAMRTFDRTRPDIGGFASGLMRRAIDECVAYANERKAFGVTIGQHQAIQFMIADMGIKHEATRLLTYTAAKILDGGQQASIYSSYAKAFGADAAMQVATDAVQVFGGYGYTKEYPVEKLMRDAKLLQIYEGTSQVQRMVIARHMLSR